MLFRSRTVLQVAGLSRDEYFEVVSAEILRRRLGDGFRAEVEPTALQVRLSRIRLTDADNAERVRELALEDGADFAELTREHTADIEHRDDGGALGWFTLDLLDAETAAAVVELQPGEIAPDVASGLLFDLYMVTEREEDRELDESQIQQLVNRRLDAWMQTERLVVETAVDLSAGEERWIEDRVGDDVNRALGAAR